jgi:hypothetical protein
VSTPIYDALAAETGLNPAPTVGESVLAAVAEIKAAFADLLAAAWSAPQPSDFLLADPIDRPIAPVVLVERPNPDAGQVVSWHRRADTVDKAMPVAVASKAGIHVNVSASRSQRRDVDALIDEAWAVVDMLQAGEDVTVLATHERIRRGQGDMIAAIVAPDPVAQPWYEEHRPTVERAAFPAMTESVRADLRARARAAAAAADAHDTFTDRAAGDARLPERVGKALDSWASMRVEESRIEVLT